MPPGLYKPAMVVHTCDTNPPEVEGQGSVVQGHPQSHSIYIAILGYRRPEGHVSGKQNKIDFGGEKSTQEGAALSR